MHVVALHEIGSLYLYRRQMREAESFYSKALRLCRYGIPVYRDEIAANLIGLATVCLSKYEYPKSLQLATEATREAQRSGNISHLIAGKRLIGTACKALGQYEEAESHLQAALGLTRLYEAPLEVARLLLVLGWLHHDLVLLKGGVLDQAKGYFVGALGEAEWVWDMFCVVEAKMSLGFCALAEKATEVALDWFEPLGDALPAGRHEDVLARIELGMACVAHQQGDLGVAEKRYGELAEWCGKLDIRSAFRAHVGLGSIYWHSGEGEKAEDAWNEALRIAGSICEGRRVFAQRSIELSREDHGFVPG